MHSPAPWLTYVCGGGEDGGGGDGGGDGGAGGDGGGRVGGGAYRLYLHMFQQPSSAQFAGPYDQPELYVQQRHFPPSDGVNSIWLNSLHAGASLAARAHAMWSCWLPRPKDDT